MREIKFRAWQDGQMLVQPLAGVYGAKRLFGLLYEDTNLMQYTGLKDKNGKEIYEGDLLAFEAWEWYKPEVVEKDYVFEVSQAESGEWVGAGICTEWATFCEIIGNIHEHK